MNMEFKYINGFMFRPWDGYLVVDNEKRKIKLSTETFKKVKETLLRNSIYYLSFGTPFDELKNIDFLHEFSFLKGISIGLDGFDIRPLVECINLEEIDLPFSYEGVIDFSHFPKLKELFINWRNIGSETVFRCKNLEKLTIFNYSGTSLIEFSELKKLKVLVLTDPKIINLAGVEELESLKEIEINGARKLVSIDHIEECQKLHRVFIHGCKQIEELHPLMYLKNLRILNLDNMGRIPSIKFLQPLKQLEEFYMGGSTNVVDGDLKVLQNLREKGSLKKTIFTNRKHYSHTKEQLGYQLSPEVAAIFQRKK